ncbi:unnamed protein product, partial [Cyprideis torosa]
MTQNGRGRGTGLVVSNPAPPPTAVVRDRCCEQRLGALTSRMHPPSVRNNVRDLDSPCRTRSRRLSRTVSRKDVNTVLGPSAGECRLALIRGVLGDSSESGSSPQQEQRCLGFVVLKQLMFRSIPHAIPPNTEFIQQHLKVFSVLALLVSAIYLYFFLRHQFTMNTENPGNLLFESLISLLTSFLALHGVKQ